MKKTLLILVCASLGGVATCSSTAVSTPPVSAQKAVTKPIALAPLPSGVTELSFDEFYRMPIGPRGLEPTEKLLRLNQQRVRITGFVAHEDEPTPGLFLLAGLPVNVGEKADGMADDLPPAVLHVRMPAQDADKVLAHRPGRWVLTGTLDLGNKEEADGRTSYARLIMDPQDVKLAASLVE